MPAYRVFAADPVKDRSTVLDLWKRNLADTNRLQEKIDWHFGNNPCGQGRYWILEADGEPVGTTSLGLRRLKAGRDVITAGVACDLAVDRKHRFLQPALILQNALLSSIEPPVRMVYGLPNPGATAVLQRVGYKKISLIDRHAKALRITPYLGRNRRLTRVPPAVGGILDGAYAAVSSFRERSNRRYVAEIMSDFDGRFDELWERVRGHYAMLTVRDSRFLRWRYRDCPLRHYTTIGLLSTDRSRLHGYLVYFVDCGYANCADLLVDGNEPKVVHSLLCKWAECARSESLTGLSIRYAGNRELTDALRGLRFVRRTVSDEPAAAARGGKETSRMLLAFSNPTAPVPDSVGSQWYFTAGDQPYN